MQFANRLILRGSSNPTPPSGLTDPGILKDSPTSYKLFNRLQAYFEVVNGAIRKDSFKMLQPGLPTIGVTEDPCFGLIGFSAEVSLDNGISGVSPMGDYVYLINEGRKAKLGQYTDQFLNGQTTSPESADLGPATPYIWSVIQIDVNGLTRSPKALTVFDNVSLFPSFWQYPNGGQPIKLVQGSPETFTSLGSNYVFSKP